MSRLPPLEKTFEVGSRDPGHFEEFINVLRDLLRDQPSTSQANLPNGIRILPRQETEGPRQWLHLRMVAPGQPPASIILWIRTDNLYLIGFEQEQPPPTGRGSGRYEFNPSNNENKNEDENKNKRDKEKPARKKQHGQQGQQSRGPLIPGASFLGIEGGYDSLGLRELVDAIRGLATYRREDAVRRGHLRTMAVTICESLRLHNICQFIERLMSSNSNSGTCEATTTAKPPATLTSLMLLYIKNWSGISGEVFRSIGNNSNNDRNLEYPHFQKCEIENTAQACEIVAMLLRKQDDDKKGKGKDKGKGKGRPKRDDEAAAALDVVPHASWQGLTFVEIFSAVVVQAAGSISNLQLYGHITIEDGLTCQDLFMRRGRSNAQLDGGHVVELTGPARAVSGYDEIVMRVDVMHAIPGAVADMTPDNDEVGSGKLVWNTYDTPGMVYDEVEEYVFDGLSGASVNVRCAVVTNAVVATVALRRTTGQGEVDVYGTVSAATAMFLPGDKVTLFDRERKDALYVGPGDDEDVVPLLRNVVVVPLRSPLVISADLWATAYVVDSTVDDHISSGAVAVFQPIPFGVFRKVISDSDDYQFEVSVTWSLS